MKYKWILPVIALSTAFTACEKETIDLYEMDDAKIYFQQHTYTNADGSEGYSTESKFSFMGKAPSLTEITFKAPVKLMGSVVNFDRSCKIIVDKENTTMEENRDFVINLDTLKIKAGKNQGEIGIRFLRSRALREGELKLTLQLQPNENFQVLEKYKSSNSWGNTTAKEIDGTRFSFTIDEVYTCPPGWARYQANKYFGEWNPTKYNYINDFFGFTNDDWGHFDTGKIAVAKMPFLARELQKHLQSKYDAGEPVLDDNGEYMQLPAPYEVDFSKK